MTTPQRLGVARAWVDGAWVDGDVTVVDGRIAEVGVSGRDGAGSAVPGFVDLQVNGFGGVDFLAAEPDDYTTARDALAATGVTAFQPTLITSRPEDAVRAIGVAAGIVDRPGPRVLGVHLEGPFLSPDRAGTHAVEHIAAPDLTALRRLLDAGPVTQVTLAPERPGGLELVAELVDRGVLVSVGHTDADADAAHAAFDAGARTVTHIYNAMRRFAPRDPGIVGVALSRPDVVVQLIADGVHVADDAVRLVLAAAGDRLVLVTDAIAAAGAGEGVWHLGDIDVTVRDGEARRGDGVLAGSVLSMDQALRNVVALGWPLEAVLPALTERPADLVGRGELGRLRPGLPADVAVLDDDLHVTRTLVSGEVVHDGEGDA